MTLFYCDPERNTECGKEACAYLLTPEEGGVCCVTVRREFARTDGNGEPVPYLPKKRKFPSGGNLDTCAKGKPAGAG
jgi:hypothetical protein